MPSTHESADHECGICSTTDATFMAPPCCARDSGSSRLCLTCVHIMLQDRSRACPFCRASIAQSRQSFRRAWHSALTGLLTTSTTATGTARVRTDRKRAVRRSVARQPVSRAVRHTAAAPPAAPSAARLVDDPEPTRSSRNASGFTGVRRTIRGSFVAEVYVNSRCRPLGTFSSATDAAGFRARVIAKAKVNGFDSACAWAARVRPKADPHARGRPRDALGRLAAGEASDRYRERRDRRVEAMHDDELDALGLPGGVAEVAPSGLRLHLSAISASGYRGVTKKTGSNRQLGQYRAKYGQKIIGYFDTALEAAEAFARRVSHAAESACMRGER